MCIRDSLKGLVAPRGHGFLEKILALEEGIGAEPFFRNSGGGAVGDHGVELFLHSKAERDVLLAEADAVFLVSEILGKLDKFGRSLGGCLLYTSSSSAIWAGPPQWEGSRPRGEVVVFCRCV